MVKDHLHSEFQDKNIEHLSLLKKLAVKACLKILYRLKKIILKTEEKMKTTGIRVLDHRLMKCQ